MVLCIDGQYFMVQSQLVSSCDPLLVREKGVQSVLSKLISSR